LQALWGPSRLWLGRHQTKASLVGVDPCLTLPSSLMKGAAEIRVVPRFLWDWRDSRGSLNNLSIIMNLFLISNRQIKTLILGGIRLNQGSYGLFLRSSSKLNSLWKIPDRRIAGPVVGRFRCSMWDWRGDFRCSSTCWRQCQSHRSMWLKRWSCISGYRGLTCNCVFIHASNRVANPGKSGSNHLLSSHWRRFISLLRKPDGMSINARRQPRSVQLPGVFLFGHGPFGVTVFFK